MQFDILVKKYSEGYFFKNETNLGLNYNRKQKFLFKIPLNHAKI